MVLKPGLAQEAPSEQSQPKRLNLFERYLSLWVGGFAQKLWRIVKKFSKETRKAGTMPI
jgi:hypothetical protein